MLKVKTLCPCLMTLPRRRQNMEDNDHTGAGGDPGGGQFPVLSLTRWHLVSKATRELGALYVSSRPQN